MKKFLAILLAAMMLLSVASVAMAEGTTTPTDQETVTIKKIYRNVNVAGASPAETFTLKQVGDGKVTDGEATSAPALGTITGATYKYMGATTTGAEANITVALPSYDKVGVYEYTLKEVANNTAGVTYYGGEIKLVVTVINDGTGKLRVAAVHTEGEGEDKKDSFENTYSAGILTIDKTVAGNLGDKTKDFEFTVTFTAPEGKDWKMYHDGEYLSINAAANQYGSVQASTPTIVDNTITYTLTLKDGGRVSFGNLPYGVTYTVTETAVEDYKTDKTGDTGTINAPTQEAKFINTKTGTIDTGVVLDTLPYVLVLAVVGAAVIAMIAKKRNAED